MSLPDAFIRSRYPRTFLAFCLLISFFVGCPAFAGLLEWTRVGPEGGEAQPIWDLQSPPGVSFVRAGGAFWKTTDGGNSWQNISKGLPRETFLLRGSRSDAQFLYALTHSGVYRTVNGGISWKQLTTLPLDALGRPSAVGMSVHPDNPATAYITRSYVAHAISVTEDGGESWRSLPIPEEYFAGREIAGLSIDPGEPHYLYVQIGSWQSLTTIRSEDGGLSWSPITGGIPLVWVNPNNEETVRVDPSVVHYPGATQYGNSVAFDPFHLRRLYWVGWIGLERQLCVSDDAGEHWTGKVVPDDVNGVVVSGPDLLLLTTNMHGVWRTADGGATLLPANNGLISSDIRSFHVFSGLPNLVYIWTGAGIYKSETRGATWQFLGENAAYPVAVDPTNTLLQFGWNQGQAARTTDGGKTWVPINLSVTTTDCRYGFSASNTIYAVAGSVFKSTDRGANWRELSNSPAPGGRILAVSPSNPDLLFLATSQGDYPVINTGFHRSTDGGDTWKTLDHSRPDMVIVDRKDPATVLRSYSGYNSGVLEKSTDLGETWTRINLAPNDLHLSSLVVDPSNLNRIFALDQDATGYETTNGGLSWRQVGPKGPAEYEVYADPLQVVFGLTRTQLYYWSDRSVFTLESPVIRERFFSHLAHGIAGDDHISTSLAFVNTGPDCDLKLRFFDDNGDPMDVELAGIGRAADFHLRLKAGASLRTETAGQAPLRTGYLRWSGGPRVTGTALFKYSRQGEVQYQVGVPEALPATHSLVLLRNNLNYAVGLALLNPGNTKSQVNLDLYDRSYQLIESRTLELRPGERIAQYASELFSSAKTIEEGSIAIRTAKPLLALSLLEYHQASAQTGRLQNRMSALPVIPDDPDIGGSRHGTRRLIFPQFADGQAGSDGVRSEIQLVNTGQSLGFMSGTVNIIFRDPLNRPIEVEVEGLGRGSLFSLPLPGGHVRTLVTSGSGPLKVGYVQIEATTQLAGVLTYRASRNGEVLYQVGITPPPFMQRFSFPFSSGAAETTALAMWSDDDAGSYPTARLFDQTGQLVETRSMTEIDPDFSGSGQTAKYAADYFEQVAGGQVTSGLISIESESTIAAINLRQASFINSANQVQLLLTSLPVAPGVPGLD